MPFLFRCRALLEKSNKVFGDTSPNPRGQGLKFMLTEWRVSEGNNEFFGRVGVPNPRGASPEPYAFLLCEDKGEHDKLGFAQKCYKFCLVKNRISCGGFLRNQKRSFLTHYLPLQSLKRVRFFTLWWVAF
jgi:hypothetical protein